MNTFLIAFVVAFATTALAAGLGILAGVTAVIIQLLLIAVGSIGIVFLAGRTAVSANGSAE